jgi:hypothetical protein
MRSGQVVRHVEGALIEVQYAAADISYQLSSDTARADDDEAMFIALVTVRRLLEDVLIVSQRRSSRE